MAATLIAPTRLDRHTYELLISTAATFYSQGQRHLTIDLSQTVCIEQSGLFALYCAHLIFQGEVPPDPGGGMAAIRIATERVCLDGQQPVELINVPDSLIPLLQRTGFRGDWA